jgi:hypothetical protein
VLRSFLRGDPPSPRLRRVRGWLVLRSFLRGDPPSPRLRRVRGVVGAAKFFYGPTHLRQGYGGRVEGWFCEVFLWADPPSPRLRRAGGRLVLRSFFMGRPTFAKATAGEWKVGAAKFFYGPIAQSVEQLAFNQWVGGSNPPRLSFSPMQTLPKAKICMTAKG